MKLISNFLDKIIPRRIQRKIREEKLLKLFEEGKILKVNEDVDNKELINGTKC